MSLTKQSIQDLFAPLSSPATAQDFFQKSVSDECVWTWGAPGSTHVLAGRYESLASFMGGTFGRIVGMMGGPMIITVQSILLDGDRAAVELRTTGTSQTGKALDEGSCWIVTVRDGVIVDVTSYIDSAALVELIEDNKAHLQ